MDNPELPRDWQTKTLETSFYQDKNTGELFYVKREGDEFWISSPQKSERQKLQFLPGQCKPFVRVDPVQYIEEKEGELSRIAEFIGEHIEELS